MRIIQNKVAIARPLSRNGPRTCLRNPKRLDPRSDMFFPGVKSLLSVNAPKAEWMMASVASPQTPDAP
jgi:hypothetical protein